MCYIPLGKVTELHGGQVSGMPGEVVVLVRLICRVIASDVPWGFASDIPREVRLIDRWAGAWGVSYPQAENGGGW